MKAHKHEERLTVCQHFKNFENSKIAHLKIVIINRKKLFCLKERNMLI